MVRSMLLKVLGPAALAIGGIPALASAHGHDFVRFSVGCGGYYAPAAYCAPTYYAPAPAVVYSTVPTVTCDPTPVVVTPSVTYAPPAVVVAPAPAPVVVYSSGFYYGRPIFYSHVHYWHR